MNQNKNRAAFGIASGRNRLITEAAFAEIDLPVPDILMCSAGSEMYDIERFIPEKGWNSHIDYMWKRYGLEEALKDFVELVCRNLKRNGVLNKLLFSG